jgi:hypothetical protein
VFADVRLIGAPPVAGKILYLAMDHHYRDNYF